MTWKAFVFFVCPTPELAQEAAHTLVNDPIILPEQCVWVSGEKQGYIHGIHHTIYVDGIGEVMIGDIETTDGLIGYSAGRPPLTS